MSFHRALVKLPQALGIVLAAPIVLLGLGLGWGLATDWRFLVQALETRSSNALDLDVQIGALAVHLSPEPVITLRKISGTTADQSRAFTIARAQLRPNWGFLWNDAPPLRRATLHGPLVAPARWPVGKQSAGAALEPADLVTRWPIGDLQVRDLSLDNAATALRIAEARLLRQDRRLVLEHARLVSASGFLEASGQLDTGSPRAAGRLNLRVSDVAMARLLDTPVRLEEHLGLASGDLRLQLVPTAADRDVARSAAAYAERLTLAADLRLKDRAADTDLRLQLETFAPDAVAPRIRVSAEGRFGGDPLRFDFTGDNPLTLRATAEPYRLEMKLRIGETAIDVHGTVDSPLEIDGLQLRGSLHGPSPARLWETFRIPFPPLPKYRIAGDLDYRDGRWELRNLDGQVGESDLQGRLSLDFGGDRLWLGADLHSQDLYLDDIAALISDPEPTEEEQGVFADRPLSPVPLRAADAKVRFHGRRVVAEGLPLNDLKIDMNMENGELRFHPLEFGVAGGDVRIAMRLDASGEILDAIVETRLRRLDLSGLLKNVPIADRSSGIVSGEGKLWLEGNSLANMLGNADGGLNLLMGGGELDPMLVEAAGLDLAELLLSWLGGAEPVALDCTYADLQFRGGIINLAALVVDTEDTLFRGDGSIDLQQERLDLVIRPYPKDASPVAAPGPLTVKGALRDPRIDVDQSAALTRVAAAAALGALASPAAGLLPLLDTGDDRQSPYCEGFVDTLRGQSQKDKP